MSTETVAGQRVEGVPPPSGSREREMTLLEHLEELRARLVKCGIALVAGLVLAGLPIPGNSFDYPFNTTAGTVIRLVASPAEGHLQAIRPGENLFTYFHVALLTAAALAMPVLVYQVMAFVLPALLPHEKKYLFLALPGVVLSFGLGVAFGYLALLPFAIGFLLNFGAELIPTNWSFADYVGTVTLLLFGMGVAFELPLIMFTLAKMGVVNARQLAGLRKYALLLAFVIGAMITPTPDPMNQTLVSLPIYLLFEIGILMARLARR